MLFLCCTLFLRPSGSLRRQVDCDRSSSSPLRATVFQSKNRGGERLLVVVGVTIFMCLSTPFERSFHLKVLIRCVKVVPAPFPNTAGRFDTFVPPFSVGDEVPSFLLYPPCFSLLYLIFQLILVFFSCWLAFCRLSELYGCRPPPSPSDF